jgi:hypothetical protein
MHFELKSMTLRYAEMIARWHYPGVYSFYDLDQDPEDFREFMDPTSWPETHFAVLNEAGDLVGFFSYEPVGTMPEHQRRGLCAALLHEGMRRLVERGAIHACIGSGELSNPMAEGVYSRASTDEDSWIGWVKYVDGKLA